MFAGFLLFNVSVKAWQPDVQLALTEPKIAEVATAAVGSHFLEESVICITEPPLDKIAMTF